MEACRVIIESLEHKNILVTGSTGFLGKIFVEKVLRVQPKVNKLFMLVRAADFKAAAQRWQNEVSRNDVFKVLKEKYGTGFESFISDKVSVIAGDVACENLGIGSSIRELLWKETNLVVNIAANTKFDERYDEALAINALGAKHVLEFSKKCVNLEMLLHVSTAYVSGEKTGLIAERPFYMGETLNGSANLDIEAEVRLAGQRLKDLCSEGATATTQRIAMKQLGMERAKSFGWPNTYVFTKAIGEMLMGHFKGNTPLVIMRPTIITSTYKEPFPGWMEGNRTVDSFITAYARGDLSSVMADPGAIMDVVPGDMVVNVMLVIMAAHLSKGSELIYHVGSSLRNPVNYALFEECIYHYFLENPRIGKDGRHMMTSRIKLYTSKAHFTSYMKLANKLPLEVLRLVNAASCNLFKRQYIHLSRKYNLVMRLASLYEPYAFFKGIFDNKNLETLRAAMLKDGIEETTLDVDLKNINWEDYFKNIHIPGVMKYGHK